MLHSIPAVASSLDTSIAQLSEELGAQMSEQGVEKVAIVGFTDLNGYKSAFGDYLSEELLTSLVSGGHFDVVERRELDRVLAEQSSYADGIFDSSTIAELQKLLGIDALITGSITDLGSNVKVNSRAISVETAKVFAASSTLMEKDETVSHLMGQLSARSGRESNPDTRFPLQKSDVYFRNAFLHVVPTSVAVSSDQRELHIVTEFRNITDEPLQIGFVKQGNLSTAAISDAGDSLDYNSISGLSTVGTADIVRSNSKYYTAIQSGSHAVVTWRFTTDGRKKNAIKGRTFSISGELFRLTESGATRFSLGLSGIQL